MQDNGDCSSNLRIDLAWNATLLFGNKVSCIPKETSIAQAAATIVEIPYVIDNDPNSESLLAPIAPTQCPIYVPNMFIHHMYIYKFKFLYIIPFSAIIIPIMLMLRSVILNTLILDTAPIPPSFIP